MNSDRRSFLRGVGALMLAGALPAHAAAMAELRGKGRLRVAVYESFPPYSLGGRGIDVDLGRALAERLGLQAEIAAYHADENMGDDLRNMVWKGHYLGTPPADVMLHVPVDPYLARQNEQVRIFGPYHVETLAVVRDPSRVGPIAGSAAVALEVFTREKIGVEVDSGSSSFLLGVLNGRLRGNVAHYGSAALAVEGLRRGEVAAVMAPRAELEAALRGDTRYVLSGIRMPELRVDSWPLGLAVKSRDEELAGELSSALAGLHTDGTVGRIFARHGITFVPPRAG